MIMKQFLRLVVMTGAILILPFGSALAQTVNGSLNGSVLDASGAAVPGAVVQVINETTQFTRTTSSQADGTYTVPQLPPGHYIVTVSKDSFATQRKTGLELLVNQSATLDFTMSTGSITQSVTVSAGAALLDTTTATLGTVIEAKAIVDLPLNGRNFTQLVLLTPGTAPHGASQQGLFEVNPGGVSAAVSGQRPQQNNYTLDGTLNNQVFANVWAIAPPPDAIQEFNVESHITDAAFSISAGANINIQTKTGTDAFHGAVWEFIRNDALDAKNYFTPAGTAATPYRQNQYGVLLGGPIVKQNTWFSAYWEGFRSRQANPYIATVPTSAEKQGDFSLLNQTIYNPFVSPRTPFADNKIPASLIDPNAVAILDRFYPSPNYGDINDPNTINNYRTEYSTKNDYDQTGIRIDHRFGRNDIVFGRFNRSNDNVLTPNSALATALQQQQNYSRQVAVGETHTFGPSIVLNLRYGFNQTDTTFADVPAGEAFYNSLTSYSAFFPINQETPYLAPWIVGLGKYTGYRQYAVLLGPEINHDGHADLTMVRGKHTIGLGTLIARFDSFSDARYNYFGFGNSGTSLNGSGGDAAASLLLGVPQFTGGLAGETGLFYHVYWYGGYVQDQWQITPKLTITAGLRYDYITPPTFEGGRTIGAFDFNSGNYLVAKPVPPLFPSANVSSHYFDAQYNGWQPRFGIAYRAQKGTVVRGSYSIFDDHNNSLIQQEQDIRQGYPDAISLNSSGVDAGIPKFTLSTLPPASSFAVAVNSSYSADPHQRIPYAMEYNAGVEQQLSDSTVLTLDYVGSQSRHLFVQPWVNVARTPGPGPAVIPYPSQPVQLNYDENIGTANYNALQAKLNRRFTKGASVLASYTWSKSMDEESDAQIGTIQNPYDIKGDYGPSDFDLRQLLSVSGLLDLPFGNGRTYLSGNGKWVDDIVGGWSVAPIIYFHTGFPVNPVLGYDDAAHVGGDQNQQRPNLIGNPYAGIHQGRSSWFNPAAFSVPVNSYGDARRNSLTSPHYTDVDLSLSKTFPVTERLNIQFRSEFFNIFNHTNLGGPVTTLNYGGFGQINSAANARQIQFALKVLF